MTEKKEKHCSVGPSSLPPRAVCPCYDSTPGGDSAQSGTRSHSVVEAILKGETEAAYMKGVTSDEIERGTWGARTILAIHAEIPGASVIASEKRVRFHKGELPSPFDGNFGTCDAHWFAPFDGGGVTLYVADYKTFGSTSADKSYCPQLMCYAVLIASDCDAPITNVVGYVVAAGDHTVISYNFTLDEARETCAEIIKAVRAAKAEPDQGDARRLCAHPSAWCAHCLHAGYCEAMVGMVESAKTNVLGGKPLAVRLALIPILKAFIDATKAEAVAVLENGGEVIAVSPDGTQTIEYRLAERASAARLVNFAGLCDAAYAYGVDMDALEAAVTVSKTAVDALFRDADKRKEDEAASRGEDLKITSAERKAAYMPFFAQGEPSKILKRIS